ncbi:MAG TPA: polyprenyl synthetase family protein [Deltaproteobacteria bacterium]|nr:polyprenyl synthetase family protein [Deltaproteobacteria bacterium]
MDVDAYMAERIPRIDAEIEARLAVHVGLPESLRGAMRHLVFPGGKRLRPLFSLAAAESVGGRAETAMPLAVAVELVHTYSLIHDDLPCMDDDDMRRGRPTVHVAYDEATAVLAGDALLTEAFAVLADPAAVAGADARIFAIGRLAEAAGASGLVGGQIDDLHFESGGGPSAKTDFERLASIHARKTAALFEAAIVGGAALAGANEAERESLGAFGRDVGIAFQIADDLLDADREEAASILRIQGIEDARLGAEGLLETALERIDGFCERAEPLRELARFAVRRRR